MAQYLDKLQVDIKDSNNNNSSSTYILGTDFDHVYAERDNNGSVINKWSLKDFIDEIKNFFSKPMFMLYSKDVPSNGSTIMECYVAWEPTNENGLDPRILDPNN